MDAIRSERFALVSAGHQFLLDVLPLRNPDSLRPLDAFVKAAADSNVPAAELDALLIRCLRFIDLHVGGTLPTLVDQYVLDAPFSTTPLEHFRTCVETSIRYAGISDGNVQDVIHLIRTRFADSAFTPNALSSALGIRSSTLCAIFKRSTNRTPSGYIRDVRLERAAQLLATTNLTVKEVWSHVGYNHGSNFGHDFKKRFGCAPGVYRARIVRPVAQARLARADGEHPVRTATTETNAAVLIVDDAEATRLTIGSHLKQRGYSVTSASSGNEGLRLAEQVHPNLIWLDYHLGDMDGLEFIRRHHESVGSDRSTIAIFTADCDVLDLAKHFHYSDVTVRSKLCDLSTIETIVEELCPVQGSAHGKTAVVTPTFTRGRGSSSAA